MLNLIPEFSNASKDPPPHNNPTAQSILTAIHHFLMVYITSRIQH